MPDDAVLERTRAFDPAALSAREARRFVRRLLAEAGREEWSDAAELAVSEVVTNVVLHAHTSFDLRVRLAEQCVRVEVRDHNPALPRQREHEEDATTGRGLALVAQVTDAHGVTPLGTEGKIVWFRIGAGEPSVSDRDPLLPAGSAAPPAGPRPALAAVHLLGLPVGLWLAARAHDDGLLRELALYRTSHDVGLTELDLTRADAARTLISATLDAALARDRVEPAPVAAPVPDLVDLALSVPAGAAPAFATLQHVLDVGERLAGKEELLVPPGPAKVTAVRAWACEQVLAQLAGGPPVRWPPG